MLGGLKQLVVVSSLLLPRGIKLGSSDLVAITLTHQAILYMLT